jgi:hypothetical protein
MTDVRSKTSDVIQHIDNILKKAKKGLYDTSKVSLYRIPVYSGCGS